MLTLMKRPGFIRLLTVRFTGNIADGLFQSALAAAIAFNPERESNPLAIAAGLAVLLLPYSLLGPFAGTTLDQWDRARVLLWANIIRATLILIVSATVICGADDYLTLSAAIAVTGASRFAAAGQSAGLPHLVARSHLVSINAFVTTLGSAFLAVGAGCAFGLRALLGADNSGIGWTIAFAALFALIAGLIASGFNAQQLGPTHRILTSTAPWKQLKLGWLALSRTPSAFCAIGAVSLHRLVFGANTLLLLVIAKHSEGGDGLARISFLAALTAAGMVLASFTTPMTISRIGRKYTLVAALGFAVIPQLLLATLNPSAITVAAFLLGIVGQTIKLCCDASLQLDIVDSVRGQVFSIQDTCFNLSFVIAVTFSALAVTQFGHESSYLPIFLFGAGGYFSGALIFSRKYPSSSGPSTVSAVPSLSESKIN